MRSLTKVSFVSLAIVLLAVVAWASDPWTSKPFSDWNQNDVNKILNDSPWTKRISVTPTWRSGGIGMGMGAPGGGEGGGGEGVGSIGGSGGMRGGGGGGGGSSRGGGTPGPDNSQINTDNGVGQRLQGMGQVPYIARWVSSKVMREALARLEVLGGQVSQPQAEQYVSQVPTDYQIVVFGPDMSPFQRIEEATIAKGSYLDMSESKLKLPPTSVSFIRAADGKQITGVTFVFPKTADGKPTVEANEKGIDLICKLKSVTFKFHFDPRKMATKDGVDL